MAAPLLLRRRRTAAATPGSPRPTPATATATTSAASRSWSTDLGAIDAREISSFPVGDGIVLRVGRYGPYVERGRARARRATSAPTSPDDLPPDELTVEYAEELLAKPSGDFELGTDPATGRPIVAKDGRYGPYVTEVLPEDTPKTGKNAVKPRTASLFKSMSLDTVTLEDALKLMSLPRVVGTDAEGVEITAQNGRYGPYLKKGTDSRSLETEEQLFTITLDEALAIYAQPKQRGRAAAKPPLKELGTDPVSERRSWSRTAASARTSPTARPTRRCAGTTTSRRSRRSAATSCSPRSAPRAPAKKAAKKAPAKKAAAKKTAAKKTAAKKTARQEDARQEDRGQDGEEGGGLRRVSACAVGGPAGRGTLESGRPPARLWSATGGTRVVRRPDRLAG